MTAEGKDGQRAHAEVAAPVGSSRRSSQASVEDAQRLLEGFALTPSEAKTLVAMMRLGSATSNQLAPVTGIDRTNLYRLLENLQDRQLVRKSPGRAKVWVAAERKEIVWRLREREEERSRAAKEALERLDAVLDEVPEPGEKAAAVVRVTDEVSTAVLYREAVTSVVGELLVFNRGPYVGELVVDPGVVAAMARGVKASALWQRHEVEGPGAEEVLGCAVAYAEAGVATAVVDELPITMAVMDRAITLVSLPGEAPGDDPHVAGFAVQSRAFGGIMAGVFERFWNQAERLQSAPIAHDEGSV